MSRYTYALLICHDYEHVLELNRILDVYEISEFKHLENSHFFVMDSNYLNIDKLTEAINSIQWSYSWPYIQLFVHREHDDKYAEVELHPNSLPPFQMGFLSSGETDEHGVLIGRWNTYRDDSAILKPAVDAARSICSDVDLLPLVVRAVVTSRISGDAYYKFYTDLFADDRERLKSFMATMVEKKGER